MADQDQPIQKALNARDHFMRREMLAMTPEERLKAMQRLQNEAKYWLEQNPKASFHFLQRNYRARSIRNMHPKDPNDS